MAVVDSPRIPVRRKRFAPRRKKEDRKEDSMTPINSRVECVTSALCYISYPSTNSEKKLAETVTGIVHR